MATIGLGFTLSANAQQMAAGINAGVVELQKLGYSAKQTQRDVSTLKTIELSRAFISSVQTVANSFSAFVAGSAAAVASVDDLSKRTGVSTQALQSYQFAAEQSGVGVETFAKGIQKLGINLGEAQTGNKTAIKSFNDLGLSVVELSRLSPEAAFESVAAAIAQLPNPAQQAAAAVSLFGKSGAELVPVFQEGAGFLEQMRAEAERLGLVLNKDQVQGLATLDDSIQKVSASFKAFGARVVAELSPQLISAAESAATFVATLDVGAVADAASAAIGGVVEVAKAAGDAFLILYKATEPLANAILPVIADTLALVADNFTGAAAGAAIAAGAFAAYALSCGGAAVATGVLTAAVTAFLSSTGVGVLVVALGALAGAFVSYAGSAETANAATAESFVAPQAAAAKTTAAALTATEAVKRFGDAAEAAFKLPAEITDETLLQGTIEKATQAFRGFAQEAGTLSAVPREVALAYDSLQTAVDNVNRDVIDQAVGQEMIAEAASEVLSVIKRISDARAAERKATEDAAAAARKSSEDAQKRVAELSSKATPESDRARIAAMQELVSLQAGLYSAEVNLIDARASGDSAAIGDAQARLRITQQTAAAAINGAQSSADLIASTTSDQLRLLSDGSFKLEPISSANMQSGVKLMQDMAAVQVTIVDAERLLDKARRSGDSTAIAAAERRLRITQQTGAIAIEQAKAQARQRDLRSLGIDESLLKPAETLKDQFLKIRSAFERGIVDGGEAKQALTNLSAEGIRIRQDLSSELSRPTQQALRGADIRTSEGASQFLALATGREDPAIEQRRTQLQKLEEIRRELVAIGANPVDILGGA